MNLSMLLFAFLAILISDCHAESPNIVKVRLESCPGCQLNSLPEIKTFIYEDMPRYPDAETKFIHGAPSELVFLTEDDEEVERINIQKYTRIECNQLLEERGFVRTKKIVKAVVRSCPGCSLSRLPEVKDFIYMDLKNYHNVKTEFISGAPPELIFIDEDGDEAEVINLEPLTREECNDLLVDRDIPIKMYDESDEELWEQSRTEL
ncbi:hypothetical protein PPYR_09408 [Photinus pyralis]|uniref:Selenoprotein M n=1 Tax=Photinus pyralis TaxID=7054 RepID=A0A5N4AM34_PHOPY|nr:selenoprotein M-like [Photinus pyralis]KAB0798415.1 hypothetical protein PPYR_09408 [Photinus pyralis]